MKNKLQDFLAGMLLITYGIFLGSPIAWAAGPTITSFFPSHSVTEAGVGTTVNIFFTALNNENDLSIGGPCLVNGREIGSTLQNFNDGSYELQYTVQATDPSRAAGTVPVSCVIQDPSHNQTTVNAFDANQLAIVTPIPDPSGGSTATTTVTVPNAPTVSTPAYATSTNESSFPLTITGLEGASLNYVVSDGASHQISGQGTIADGKYSTSLDISSLIDGTITASATQTNGTTSPAGTTTAIKDTSAPVFGTIQDFIQTTTGTSTTINLPTPSVTDTIDPNPVITNDAPILFPLGTSTIIWTAQDHAGNSATSSQNIIITQSNATSTATSTDSTGGTTATTTLSAPIISVPMYASSTNDTSFKVTIHGQDGASLTYVISDGASHSVTTADTVADGAVFGTFNLENFSFVDGPITVTATQILSGTTSPVGTATSTKDTVAPVFGTTTPITQTTSGSTATVLLTTPTVTDAIDQNPIITNDAPTVFPLGTTTVIWTAQDHAGNIATTSQTVVITEGTPNSGSSGGNSGGSITVNPPANGPIIGLIGYIHTPVISVTPPSSQSNGSNPGAIVSVVRRAINLSRTLRFGMRGNDVSELQRLLAEDPTIYPEAYVTGYFGPLTRQAVIRFQLKNGIVSNTKDLGLGMVGPKTISKLGEVSSNQELSVQHSE